MGDPGTYMNETGGNNNPGAELLDNSEDDARAIHLEHLLHNQGRIHGCSSLALLLDYGFGSLPSALANNIGKISPMRSLIL